MKSFAPTLESLVRCALAEDLGPGDITSLGSLPGRSVNSRIVAKSDGVLSGLDVVRLVFQMVDSKIEFRPGKADADRFASDDLIVALSGNDGSILGAERTAINFLAHLSGVATLTARFVEAVKGTDCRILDTRKTTPGLRHLEKQAVAHGGGMNHRMGLHDMVLIKDNHIAAAGSITAAVEQCRSYLASAEYASRFGKSGGQIDMEVEISSLAELTEAIEVGILRLLLDNQSTASLGKMVRTARELSSEVVLEASGNVTLENVAEVASTGVDCISVGALTHSARACDFSLQVID